MPVPRALPQIDTVSASRRDSTTRNGSVITTVHARIDRCRIFALQTSEHLRYAPSFVRDEACLFASNFLMRALTSGT